MSDRRTHYRASDWLCLGSLRKNPEHQHETRLKDAAQKPPSVADSRNHSAISTTLVMFRATSVGSLFSFSFSLSFFVDSRSSCQQTLALLSLMAGNAVLLSHPGWLRVQVIPSLWWKLLALSHRRDA